MALNAEYVASAHDDILNAEGGLPGYAQAGPGGVEAVLARVENHAHYAGLDDVFGIAAMYATAIARGHVFNDGNKRTALVCTLAYLEHQGNLIERSRDIQDDLVEVMVDVAAGKISSELLADYLSIFHMISWCD
jgi:death on curing protein